MWLYLEEIMRRKMFLSKTELVKEALREYVTRHRDLLPDFEIVAAVVELREGRLVDEERERRLLEWVAELRARQ